MSLELINPVDEIAQDLINRETNYRRIEESVNQKADSTDVTEALNLKANSADVYTQDEVDGLLDNKANINDVYTKTEVDNALATKQDKAITIDEQATTVEGAIQANFGSINDLQAQIDGKVYGIQIDHTTGDVVRTGNAVGMTFGSPDGINPIESDFDNVFPYNEIYNLKIDSTGNKKYQTDDDYSTFDGSMYAHIPSFYIRDITIGDIRNISVSNKALKGYTKVDERYVGCFHAGYENGELISKVEKAVKVNTSYTGFHNILDTQDGVYMYDMTTFHAIVALSYIEMGSLDHKSKLGLGIQSGMPYGSSGYDIKVATTDSNTVTVDSSRPFYVGMMVQVGTFYTNNSIASDRYITNIVDNGDGTQTLTLDGGSFSVSVGDTCVTWAQPVPQEAVDAIGDGSGYYLQFGSQSRSHVCYRGIWDLYGNAWQFVAGFMRYDGKYYGCTDASKMNVTDPRNQDGWVDLGVGEYADNGYQRIRKAIKIDGGYIDVPIEWGNVASSNTFYSAYLYSFSSAYQGARVLRLGGLWDYGSYVSPVCSSGYDSPSSSNVGFGSRVIRYN